MRLRDITNPDELRFKQLDRLFNRMDRIIRDMSGWNESYQTRMGRRIQYYTVPKGVFVRRVAGKRFNEVAVRRLVDNIERDYLHSLGSSDLPDGDLITVAFLHD